MLDHLLLPFQYEYMVRAMWVCGLTGGVCGLLSGYVTLKGWSLMGDALSHAVVPGVALAALAGWPLAVGAFIAGMLAVGAMGFIKSARVIREDAAMGVVFTAFFALGLVLISKFPSGVDLKTIVFGNVLAIGGSDVVQLVGICGVVVAVVVFKWRDLMLCCFDPAQARSMGLRVSWYEGVLLAMLSAMAVGALITVGAVLVMGLLVAPGATAYLLTDRFGRMLWIAAGLGAGASFLGAYASFFINGATGGCVVCLQALCFVVALIWAPRHGLLARGAMGKGGGV